MKRLLVAVLALAAAYFIYQAPNMVQSAIPSIYYVTPSQKTYQNVVSCPGTVQPEITGSVYLEGPGRVGEVFFSPGDEVEAGDIIATVEPVREWTDAMSASMSEANGLYGSSPEGLISAAILYGMSSGVGGGLTDYGDLAGILPSAREEDTRARANTLADETEGRITAPISGVVTDMSLTEKAYALPGIPAVTISSKNDFKVIASVAEADISRLSLGDNARIQSAGYPKKIYYGSVSRIYPSARKTLSGTSTQTVVTIEIILKNSDGNLKPGFSANVEIYGGNDQVLITVPYEAVRQDENNDEYVFVYEDGALKKRPVITGRELTSEVEVLSGITEGSIVIYNPSEAVREGQIIQLKGRAAVD